MKKLTVLLLLAALLLLPACGTAAPAVQPSPEPTALPTPEATAAPTAVPEPKLPYRIRNYSTGSYIDLPDAGSAANGALLADDDALKVTLLRTRYQTEATEYELDFLVENRSEQPVFLEAGPQTVVDGYAFPSFANADLAAGELREITLYVLAEEFWLAGISTPQELKFSLSLYDSSSPENAYRDTYYFAVSPSGLTASQVQVKSIWDMGFSNNEYTNASAGVSYRILDAKFIEEGTFYRIDLVLENSSGEYRSCTWTATTVNGVETDPLWSADIPAGANILTHIYLDMDELRAKGVSEPDEIAYTFVISNGTASITAEDILFRPAKG